MRKMILYSNEIISFMGCPGCAYKNHEFELPCGIAYENDSFILSQDWELPIQGFMVVSPKKCIERFSELTKDEKIEIFEIVDKTIAILKDNNVCSRFNVIFEEKENSHFHIWIMPRHKWMLDTFGDITENIGLIFEYAKENLKTEENYFKIKEITNILKEKFKK